MTTAFARAADAGHPVLAIGFKVPKPGSVSNASRMATRVTALLSNNLLEGRLATADHGRLLVMST